MSTPWTTSIKTLNPVRRPEPPVHPPAGGFSAPALVPVNVAPLDLFKSIARCTAMSRSSVSLIAALVASSQVLLEYLVDDATSTIAFLDEVTDLADSERTALSGRMGAGITDQAMEALGLVWRDVAEQLIDSRRAPLADYVYESATGALVLAEAKGSISNAASQSGVDTRAGNAYQRQVNPYVYQTPPLPAPGGMPSLGLIEHGYAVAFAGLPGPAGAAPPAIAADAFLAIAETALPVTPTATGTPAGGGAGVVPPPGSSPPDASMLRDPTRFALRLGNYRAVFVLVNGPHVVDTIDRVLSGRDPEPLIQRFWQVECGGREFLVGYDPEYKPIKLLDPHLQGWSFAIEVGSAEAILEQLVNAVKPAFPGLALPILPRIAMSVDPPSSFLLSPDGYAMIRRSAAWVVSEVEWKADFGLVRRAVAARLL